MMEMEVMAISFDMVSWYWMPDVFQRSVFFFGLVKKFQIVRLEKLSPAYRSGFGRNDYIDIEDTPEKIVKLSKKNRTRPWKTFRKNSWMKLKENYRIAMQDLVYNPVYHC